MQSDALALPPGITSLVDHLPPYTVTGDTGMVFGEYECKYVTWEFDPALYDRLEISQITDVQFGHICCRYDRVKEYRDWILSEPYRFMLWCGDMVDAWALWSPGLPWEQQFAPDRQIYKFCELWAPARHRILGSVGGNHERRATKGFGDLGLLIAKILQIPYSAGQQWIDLMYGKHAPYKVNLWHGRGNPRTLGTVAQMVDRHIQQTDADLCLIGHVHTPLIAPIWKQYRDRSHRQVRLRKCFGAVGSSFMDFFGTYGETMGMRGHDVLMPRLILTPDGRSELTLK
jgi:hypothetical protein